MTTTWRRLRNVVLVAGMASASAACSGELSPTGSSPLAPPTSMDGLEYGRVENGSPSTRSTARPTAAPLTPEAVAGTWTLFTVDGAPLPFVMARDGEIKIELLGDTLTLRENGTSTERAESRFTAGARVQTDTTVENGSYVIDGNTLQLVGRHGRRRTATTNGALLIASVDGMTWVFRKSYEQ